MQYLHVIATYLFLRYTLVVADFVPSGHELDLILRQIGDSDLGLVGAGQSNGEDIFLLQRRVPAGESETEECTDDCAGFNAWASSDESSSSLETPESSEIITRAIRSSAHNNSTASDKSAIPNSPRSLSKREGKKKSEICANTEVDGKIEDRPIKLKSLKYPNFKVVDEVSKYHWIYQPRSLTLA